MIIKCKCGCEKELDDTDKYGRKRTMIKGHGKRNFKVTEETRKKISLIHKGKKLSEERKKQMSLSRKGKPNLKMRGFKPKTESLIKAVATRRKNGSYKLAENNPVWKGGKFKSSHGYINVYCPTHPFNKNKYVYEHRLVMEKHLGRTLLLTEVVHHINGDKKDNRIENLMLFENNGKHINHHKEVMPWKWHKK